MMRNDYRRALILLRGNAPGYSGHVRLERRTLMGSMYFLAQTPADCPALRVALVGRGRDGYFACALGEMRRDSRGQAVLCHSFDPRNICGRELEQYQLFAVTCAGDADCRVLLFGNVNGHAELNWERVRTALCGLYAGNVAREGATEAPPVGGLPEAGEEPADVSAAETDEAARAPVEAEEPAAEAPEEPYAPEEASVQTETAEAATETMDGDARAQRACDLLDLDVSLPWPDGAESLRALFQTLPPLENPPDEEYVYIAAPMPDDSGYPYCAAGIRVEDGVPISVRYALPATWTDEAPAGLEDYSWVGNQNRGWWMAEAPL